MTLWTLYTTVTIIGLVNTLPTFRGRYNAYLSRNPAANNAFLSRVWGMKLIGDHVPAQYCKVVIWIWTKAFVPVYSFGRSMEIRPKYRLDICNGLQFVLLFLFRSSPSGRVLDPFSINLIRHSVGLFDMLAFALFLYINYPENYKLLTEHNLV